MSRERGVEKGGKGSWDTPMSALGLRTAQYLSYVNIKPRMTEAERRRRRYLERKHAQDNAKVSFGSGPAVTEEDEDIEEEEAPYVHDAHADEHVEPLIRSDSASEYTMMMLVSEADLYYGGDLLVRKYLVDDAAGGASGLGGSKRNASSSSGSGSSGSGGGDGGEGADREEGVAEEEDVYDEEEAIDPGLLKSYESLEPAPKPKKVSGPKYHAFKTSIGRYTPERGNLIIFKSNHEHGMHTLYAGVRYMLLLEFWPYMDAHPAPHRATLGEARPFEVHGDEL